MVGALSPFPPFIKKQSSNLGYAADGNRTNLQSSNSQFLSLQIKKGLFEEFAKIRLACRHTHCKHSSTSIGSTP